MPEKKMYFAGCLFFLFPFFILNAQNNQPVNDTSYYERYRHKLIVAPIVIKQVNAFGLKEPGNAAQRYYMNRPAGIGLRLGYDWLAFDFTLSAGSLDPDYKTSKGITKSSAFNASFTPKNFMLDVYLQKHQGYYLQPQNNPQPQWYYTRPDIKTSLAGVDFMYLFNGDRFSARPPLKLDTWQKKSAGSFLLGAEIFHGSARGDSAFAPSGYAALSAMPATIKAAYLAFGPGAGYGHSFVYRKHLFLTLLGVANADIVRTAEWEARGTSSQKWRFRPNMGFRSGIGYNSENVEVSLYWFSNRIYFGNTPADYQYQAYGNLYKLGVTKRLNPGKTLPKVVNWVGNIIEKMGLGFLIR